MRVIVTGSRAWTDEQAVYGALWGIYKEYGPFQLVHGDCSTGADAMAHHWYTVAGLFLDVIEHRYPAAWHKGRSAGPERNERMVKAGADLVLAFPLGGPGTAHTMQLARDAGIPVQEHGKRER